VVAGRGNLNKKHLKNVGPIRYCEPFYIAIHQVSLLSHAATVARRLSIDVHDNDNKNNNNDNAWQRGPLWPHRMGPTTSRAMLATDRPFCSLKNTVTNRNAIRQKCHDNKQYREKRQLSGMSVVYAILSSTQHRSRAGCIGVAKTANYVFISAGVEQSERRRVVGQTAGWMDGWPS